MACGRGLPQSKQGLCGLNGCRGDALGLAPPALTRVVPVRLQDVGPAEAGTGARITAEDGLLSTHGPAVLSVVDGQLGGHTAALILGNSSTYTGKHQHLYWETPEPILGNSSTQQHQPGNMYLPL